MVYPQACVVGQERKSQGEEIRGTPREEKDEKRGKKGKLEAQFYLAA